jgi:hypothetical protein
MVSDIMLRVGMISVVVLKLMMIPTWQWGKGKKLFQTFFQISG